MYAILSLMLAYAAFVSLSLAMNRHHEQALARRPSAARARVLRGAGWLLLGLSFPAAVAAQGWGIGPVLWFGLLSVSALVVVVLLPYRPRAVPGLALTALLVAPLLLLASFDRVPA